MGIRFRKSINIGPLRINLSKSGVGFSIGNSLFRFTKTAKGNTRKTFTIPETGISYIDERKNIK
jgi:hypothetical protein